MGRNPSVFLVYITCRFPEKLSLSHRLSHPHTATRAASPLQPCRWRYAPASAPEIVAMRAHGVFQEFQKIWPNLGFNEPYRGR